MGNKSSKGDLQRESQEPLLQPARSNDEELGERKENEQENQSSTSKETPKVKKVSLGRLMGLGKCFLSSLG